MDRLRFIMIGGFLGAGKTTTLARLARHYMNRGRRVGIVTNDQAQNLVDTNSLEAQGFSVAEVPGACFCCRFDDLITQVQRLQSHDLPDVILAEPVGSCTDLVATVVQPLKDIYRRQFQVAPYAVLFKPSHGLRILRNDADAGFSAKAAYIFRKQLEEADAIVVNRLDELSADLLHELQRLLARDYPGVPVLPLSAKSGQGFEALTELLNQDGHFGHRILDIDYDVYAEGEAELGWLNSSMHVASATAFDLDAVLLDIINRLGSRLRAGQQEIAHLKVIGVAGGAFGVANLVSNQTEPELSLASRAKITEAEITVNARVAADPAAIEALVRETLDSIGREHNGDVLYHTMQSFRPGRPQPTHRYATVRA